MIDNKLETICFLQDSAPLKIIPLVIGYKVYFIVGFNSFSIHFYKVHIFPSEVKLERLNTESIGLKDKKIDKMKLMDGQIFHLNGTHGFLLGESGRISILRIHEHEESIDLSSNFTIELIFQGDINTLITSGICFIENDQLNIAITTYHG